MIFYVYVLEEYNNLFFNNNFILIMMTFKAEFSDLKLQIRF